MVQMKRQKRKSESVLCLLLLIMFVLFLAVGIGTYYYNYCYYFVPSSKTTTTTTANGSTKIQHLKSHNIENPLSSSLSINKVQVSTKENQKIRKEKDKEESGAAEALIQYTSPESLSTKQHLVYGTAWKKEKTSELVYEAIWNGFRYIDTASQTKHYDEKGVGDGWKQACDQLGLKRQDIYLQSKFSRYKGDSDTVPYDGSKSIPNQVRQSFQIALSNLRTDYLDGYLLHSPYKDIQDTLQVWNVFAELKHNKKIRYVGISNIYDIDYLRELYHRVTVKPAIVQNRFHAKTKFDTDIRQFCRKHDIVYQSFWTLTANRKALQSPIIKRLAQKKECTPQTLMYGFMITLGYSPLDGTTNTSHMKEDLFLESRILQSQQDDENNKNLVLEPEELKTISDILGIHTLPSPQS